MSKHYNNAPLIEVIAEVRWPTPEDSVFQGAATGVVINIPPEFIGATETFYNRFAVLADDMGFRNSERLVPHGIGSPPGQPVIRYRQKASQPPLMQIGTGLFTANGLPPTYNDWDTFSPVLRDGLEALTSARAPSGMTGPFSVMTLRYLNAFGRSYWENRSASAFIRDVLKFDVTLPNSARAVEVAGEPGSIVIQRKIPLKDGGSLNLNVGEGSANNEVAVILDMSIEFVHVESEDAYQKFDYAHRIASNLFQEMVADIEHLLEPEEH